MRLFDYHTHNIRCRHAFYHVDSYVDAAITKNLEEIGISDHFPMDLLPEYFHKYAMPMDDFPEYIADCKRLRAKFEGHITIKIATEVDYFKKSFSDYKKALKPFMDDLDYLIGSIHAITTPKTSVLPIDESVAIPQIKEAGIDYVYVSYYDSLIELVQTRFYDIIGHLDVPKKYGLLPMDTNLVWQKVLTVLDHIESSEMVVEINTSGFRKFIGEPYPSNEIISELINREIPLTLGSDAHTPEDIAFNFDTTLAYLRKKGVKYLIKFNQREKSRISID